MISIVVPGIRPQNWIKLYNSILNSTAYPFELIFVGPNEPPTFLQNQSNVSFFKDFGSPARCGQIGMIRAKYPIFHWSSDDCIYLPGAIDEAISGLDMDNYKSVVVCKYTEGDNPDTWHVMLEDQYYHLNSHDCLRSPGVDNKYIGFNLVFMHLSYLKELGGLDCNFNVHVMATNDLAVRAQMDKAQVKLHNKVLLRCSHQPKAEGDHGPIYNAQHYHDLPIYHLLYDNQLRYNRIRIDINNWEKSNNRWSRFSV